MELSLRDMKGTNCFVLKAFGGSCCFLFLLTRLSFPYSKEGKSWKVGGGVRLVYVSEALNSLGRNEIRQNYNFSLFSAISTDSLINTIHQICTILVVEQIKKFSFLRDVQSSPS